jgi:RHS repeat-associated protein
VRHVVTFSGKHSALSFRRSSELESDGLILALDATGSRATRTDGNGFTTIYRYDSNCRLSEIEYPDGKKVQYAFDERGNKVFEGYVDPEQNFAATTRTFTYDELNRLRSMKDSSLGKTIQYEFDENGNRSKIIDGEGGVITFDYDPANRLSKITDQDGEVTRLEYDVAGRRTKLIYPNGTWAAYTYDASSRVLSIIYRTRTNEIFLGFTYAYDLNGNRLYKKFHDGTQETYRYDDANRLVEATYADGVTERFQYDLLGNRIRYEKDGQVTNSTFNSYNQIVQSVGPEGTTDYVWDDNGNLLSKTVNGVPELTLGWDFENRLRTAQTQTGQTLYSYRPDGIRVLSDRGAANKSYYLLDNVSVVAEYDATGALSRSNVFTDRIDEIISTKTANGDKLFYHPDALGSIYRITDPAGNVVNKYEYRAYGEIALREEAKGNKYLWQGREGTTQRHFRNRYFDATIGWLSADRLGGNSKYHVFSGNPVRFGDPLGLFCSEGINLAMNLVCGKGHAFITSELLNLLSIYSRFNNSYHDLMVQGNVDVDRGPLTDPVPHALKEPLQLRSFAEALTEAHIIRVLKDSHQSSCANRRDDAAKALGASMHTLQDEVAHNYANLLIHLGITIPVVILMNMATDPFDAVTDYKMVKSQWWVQWRLNSLLANVGPGLNITYLTSFRR